MLQIPSQLKGLGGLPDRRGAAGRRVSAEEAAAATADLDARERGDLEEALGFRHQGCPPRQAQAAMKDLEDQQKARAKRLQRDAIDRALTELTGFYRDLLSVQTGSGAGLVNADLPPRSLCWPGSRAPESTLRRIDALLGCRTALEGNVAPLLAVESTLIALVEG